MQRIHDVRLKKTKNFTNHARTLSSFYPNIHSERQSIPVYRCVCRLNRGWKILNFVIELFSNIHGIMDDIYDEKLTLSFGKGLHSRFVYILY